MALSTLNIYNLRMNEIFHTNIIGKIFLPSYVKPITGLHIVHNLSKPHAFENSPRISTKICPKGTHRSFKFICLHRVCSLFATARDCCCSAWTNFGPPVETQKSVNRRGTEIRCSIIIPPRHPGKRYIRPRASAQKPRLTRSIILGKYLPELFSPVFAGLLSLRWWAQQFHTPTTTTCHPPKMRRVGNVVCLHCDAQWVSLFPAFCARSRWSRSPAKNLPELEGPYGGFGFYS